MVHSKGSDSTCITQSLLQTIGCINGRILRFSALFVQTKCLLATIFTQLLFRSNHRDAGGLELGISKLEDTSLLFLQRAVVSDRAILIVSTTFAALIRRRLTGHVGIWDLYIMFLHSELPWKQWDNRIGVLPGWWWLWRFLLRIAHANKPFAHEHRVLRRYTICKRRLSARTLLEPWLLPIGAFKENPRILG